MIYHGLNDKRLKTVTFPFEDGSHPTYYIPAEASDLINNSTASGATVKDALDTIDSEVLATLTQRSAKPGSIVTFEDGADDVPLRHLEFDINPVQDLHGQENPYPAGGGKNLLDPSTAQRGTSITYANGIWTFAPESATQVLMLPIADTSYDGKNISISFDIWGSNDATIRFDGQPDSVYSSDTDFADKTILVTATKQRVAYSGIVLENTTGFRIFRTSSFNGATTVTVYVSNIQLEFGSATDYVPYSNICPITGYTGAEVSVTGKNYFPVASATSSGAINIFNNFPLYVPAGKYYLSFKSNASRTVPMTLRYYFEDGTSDTITIGSSDSGGTIVAPLAIIKVTWYVREATNISEIQLESGSSATDYEPYGNTYSISFPSSAGTVYSGHVTVEKDGSGTLVVDKANVDLGTLTWNRTTSYSAPVIYANVAGKKASGISMLCSVYKFSGNFGSASGFANSSENESIGNCYSNEQIFVRDDSYTDAATFKSAMSGVQLVYELATPITYTLDPVQVKSLLGLNNVWVNTGDITDLTYYVGGEYKDAEDKRDIIEATIPYDTASGAIATFPDGADNVRLKQLSVGINPVQDLHGYDNPWPAGGSVNKLSISGSYTKATDGYAVPITDIDKIPAGEYVIAISSTNAIAWITTFYNESETAIITVSSDASSAGRQSKAFTLNEDAHKIRIYVNGATTISDIQVEAGSTPTDYKPYSNLCPITGHIGAEVTRCGKNLFDQSQLLQANGWTEANGVYSGSNAALHNAFKIQAGGFKNLVFKANTRYTISLKARSANDNKLTVIGFHYTDGTNGDFYLRGTTETSYTFTSNASKTVEMMYGSYGGVDTVYISEFKLEEGSTVTDYEEYRGATYPITFPDGTGTVYGGNVTVNRDGSGSLVVDRAKRTIRKFEGVWGSTGNGYAVFISATRRSLNWNIAKCNQFKLDGNSYTSMPLYSFLGGSGTSTTWSFILPNTVTSLPEANAWLSNLSTPLEIIYALETLLTIPLAAPQITTLLGTNNIWSDTNGDVSVNYPCDVGLFITKELEELVGDNG